MLHKLTDVRPKMVPAVYDWLLENFERVHIGVVVNHPGLVAPPGLPTSEHEVGIFVDNPAGTSREIHPAKVEVLILNFGLQAIGKFYRDDNGFGAQMRFSGKPTQVHVPYSAVIFVASPDDITNKCGMNFPLYYGQEDITIGGKKTDAELQAAPAEEPKSRPNFLTRVK